MKKKAGVIFLCIAMAATAVIGGTMAYFTDNDKKENSFTVGSVKIDLVEQQRNKAHTGLEPFENGKTLMPIVGSAQGEKDQWGLPTAENYVDKIIDVKNTGKSMAYVRMFLAVPVVLDNVGDAAQNILHFNWNEDSMDQGQWSKEVCTAENVEVNGVLCNVYSRTYAGALAAGEVTGTHAYTGFYLDQKVDQDDTGYTIDGKHIDFDFSKGIVIPVYAQGVQADGFANAEAAFGASGLPVNPWAK